MTADVLVVADGAMPGTGRLQVDVELLIGRSAVTHPVFADDDLLSRSHARVRATEGGLEIEDLGSTNGTYVNAERISGSRLLRLGDQVRVGRTTLEVRPALDDTNTSIQTEELSLPVEQVGSPSALHPIPATTGAEPPAASVLFLGRRVPVPAEGLRIGRLEENDVVVHSDQASRWHARIAADEGRYYIVDVGSRNGTYLNGEHLVDQARWLNPGDTIVVAGETVRFLTADVADAAVSVTGVSHVKLRDAPLTIGRDPSNAVQLDDPSISRFHANVTSAGGQVVLNDLGSRNGTRVDGEFVTCAVLWPGYEVGIGSFRLVFDGTGFVQRDDRGILRLEAFDLVVQAGKRTLLDRASLSVEPGEFVVIIGESGSGKSTMLKALAGVTKPSSGEALVNGEAVSSHLANIGYVPQDDIVHHRLTVREALRYAGRLRLPDDSSQQDVEVAVMRVLEEVSLVQRADNRIGSLSGGERKRVSLATELLNRPGLLFLDEPTTGLDPGLEGRMMELFRSLAAVGRHALVVVTHATRSLDLADKLCVMARGGELCFVGPPHEAKAFFGVASYDEIYTALDRRRAGEWRQSFLGRVGARSPQPVARPTAQPRRVPVRAVAPQSAVLISRYIKLFVRDRRNVAILLLQVPLLALVIAMLFRRDVLGDLSAQTSSSASQLLFLIVMTTAWFGTLDSAREVIKERTITIRERAVGVSLHAYLTSKVVVLFALVALQATILLLVLLALRPFEASIGSHVLLFVVVYLTGFAAVSMGLAISSLVTTEEQAVALIPISMIVQLLFGGAVVTIKSMGAMVGGVSAIAFSRWAYSGIGTVADMNDRIAADATFSRSNQFAQSFFDLEAPIAFAVLFAFVAFFLVLAIVGLRRSAWP